MKCIFCGVLCFLCCSVFGFNLTVNNLTGVYVTNSLGSYNPILVTPPGQLIFDSATAESLYQQALGTNYIPAVLTNDFVLTIFRISTTVTYTGSYAISGSPSTTSLLLDFTCGLILSYILGKAFLS
jgi:hypothetical protein